MMEPQIETGEVRHRQSLSVPRGQTESKSREQLANIVSGVRDDDAEISSMPVDGS